MRKRTIGILAAVLLLVVGGVVWAVGGREDPAVQKVRQLRNEAFAGGGPPNQQKMEELRKAEHALAPEQREKLHDEMRNGRENPMDKQIAGYFALPPAQRNVYLDEQIKNMEKWRKEMEARRAKQGQGQNRAGPPQGQPGAGGGNQQGPNAGGPGGPGGGQNRSPEARLVRRNARLDHSTPAQRAQRTAYFAALQKRRIELGLPANPPHGHGPGGR